MFPNATPYFSQAYFKANRDALLATLPENSVVVIGGNKEATRSRDTTFTFRQNSDFEHLSGFLEPDSLLVLCHSKIDSYILFVREKDPVMEIWHGRRQGPKGAIENFGADQSFVLADIPTQLPTLLLDAEHIYYSLYRDDHVARLIQSAVLAIRSQSRSGITPPVNFHDIDPILHAQRLIKKPEEIAMLQLACDISVNAHLKAMEVTRPGMMEYHLASTIHHEFENYGGTWGYSTIVGGGENGCILHYTENNQRLNAHDLVLIDAGCELHGFTGDITHTYPVSGVMSEPQLAVYHLVWNALKQATNTLIIGNDFNDYHMVAVKILTQGLKDLGLLTGNLTELIKNESYKRFYMHRTGHYLGRDVHDVGTYFTKNGSHRPLENNMVITVEPGLYIPNDADIPKEFRGIGIRLEDDVVVHNQTPIVLTKQLPRDPDDLKELIGKN